MKKMISMLLAGVLATGTFVTTAFAYTGDETSTAQETETEVVDTIDPDMAVLPDGYDVKVDEDGKMTVTVDGKEYTLGTNTAAKQTGTVVSGITSLHFRTGPGMDYEIIGYLHSGDQVDVLEKTGDWYKVVYDGQTGYVHGKYLNVYETGVDSSIFSEDALKLFMDMMLKSDSNIDEENTSDKGLTPEGNLTLVDDIGAEDQSGQQFITLVTKAGNTFYLIIDRDADGNQNVHFLNKVDEADLLALMDEDEAAKYQAAEPEVTEPAATETPSQTEEPAPAPEQEPEKKSSTLPVVMLLLFVIGVAGVGGYLFIKMKGGKPGAKADKPDPDADYHDEDEEVIELPEDSDYSEDDDINAEYEADSDDEPV